MSVARAPRLAVRLLRLRRGHARSGRGAATAAARGTRSARGVPSQARRAAVARRRRPAAAQPLDSVGDGTGQRRPTGIDELDRVLGGGVVSGSLILLGGDPGIGKSTLALQLAARMGRPGHPVLYCAGEESALQVAMRAERLGCRVPSVAVLAETDLDALAGGDRAARGRRWRWWTRSRRSARPTRRARRAAPATCARPWPACSPSPRRPACPSSWSATSPRRARSPGPRTLEHMVDVVLYLEGERHGEHRLLRGVKNRFGSTGELGLFTMESGGLRQLDAPGRAFLDENSLAVPGQRPHGHVRGHAAAGRGDPGAGGAHLVRPAPPHQLRVRPRPPPPAPRRPRAPGGRPARPGRRLPQRGRRGAPRPTPSVDLGVALALAGAARDQVLPARHGGRWARSASAARCGAPHASTRAWRGAGARAGGRRWSPRAGGPRRAGCACTGCPTLARRTGPARLGAEPTAAARARLR